MIPAVAVGGAVTIRYFAGAAEAAGCEEERLEVGGLGPATSGTSVPGSHVPGSHVPGSRVPGSPVPGSHVPGSPDRWSVEPAPRATIPTSPEPAPTVADLRATLVAAHGAAFARVLGRCSILIGGVRADDSDPVPEGAVVDVLPPFAGG